MDLIQERAERLRGAIAINVVNAWRSNVIMLSRNATRTPTYDSKQRGSYRAYVQHEYVVGVGHIAGYGYVIIVLQRPIS